MGDPNTDHLIETSDVSSSSNQKGKTYGNTTRSEGSQFTQAGGQWSGANCFTGFLATVNSTVGSSKRISDSSLNGKENTYLKDPTKPDGEACNNDRTLKNASELEWLDSPSQPNTFGYREETEGVWDHWNVDNDNALRTSIVSKVSLE